MTDLSSRGVRVEQKWGFGMAPVKPHVQAERRTAAERVMRTVADISAAEPAAGAGAVTLDALSTVKGLFNRCHRQDQWDWFTVWQQLGRPGRPFTVAAGSSLAWLRDAVRDGDAETATRAVAAFREAGGHVHLGGFVKGRAVDRPGIGYVYVLFTREQPRLLKIGYTERQVEERVKEINSSTGVAVPYGVRAVWAVEHVRAAEAELHERLAPYRIRSDREFFDIDFRDAFPIIRDYVAERRREM